MKRPPNIEALESLALEYRRHYPIDSDRLIEGGRLLELISYIKHLESQNQWIKCSDRLPEKDKMVLTWKPLRLIPEKGYFWIAATDHISDFFSNPLDATPRTSGE